MGADARQGFADVHGRMLGLAVPFEEPIVLYDSLSALGGATRDLLNHFEGATQTTPELPCRGMLPSIQHLSGSIKENHRG